MRLIERTGNIFNTDATAIGHGVNTRGVMGAGIAKQFRVRFPAMYDSYSAACRSGQLNPGECLAYPDRSGLLIANIASQDAPGPRARLVWLRTGVASALVSAAEHGHRVLALPQIGCGIGGLAWGEVLPVLGELAASGPVDIEAWTFA